MATVTKPIALDESLNTTELSSRNVADVLAQELSAVATAIGGIAVPSADHVSYDNSVSGLSATDVQNALDEIVGDIPTALSELSDDSTHRLVTDSEKAEWNATTPTDTTDDEPYVLRQGKGNQVDFSLEGASVAWNQLVKCNRASTTMYDVIITKVTGGYTLSGTASEYTERAFDDPVDRPNVVANHVYFFGGVKANSNVKLYAYFTGTIFNTTVDTIVKPTLSMSNCNMGFNVDGGKQVNTTIYPTFIDLTQLFGTTIADAIYAMEQATSGSGVAFFRKYFPKSYYAYDSGSIQSVCVSERKVYDSDNNLVANYPLPTTQLRGLFSLVNGKLKANGDVLRSDGNITRNYGYRAYQSGDESLANAITDGTNTVYKLTTPTSETTSPFQNPQRAYPDGTEEFVDGLTRDVIVPVGNNSTYTTSDVLASADDYTDGMGKMLLPISAVGTDESGRTTASRAYTTGEFFYMDGKMYKVLASIASGATFTVGTNILETTLFAELTALA